MFLEPRVDQAGGRAGERTLSWERAGNWASEEEGECGEEAGLFRVTCFLTGFGSPCERVSCVSFSRDEHPVL